MKYKGLKALARILEELRPLATSYFGARVNMQAQKQAYYDMLVTAKQIDCWDINGKIVYAINLKNAMRKAANMLPIR